MKDNKFVKLEDGTIVNVENISLIYFKKRGAPYESSYHLTLKKDTAIYGFDITENDYKMLTDKLTKDNNQTTDNLPTATIRYCENPKKSSDELLESDFQTNNQLFNLLVNLLNNNGLANNSNIKSERKRKNE